jgi:hypothetical protein
MPFQVVGEHAEEHVGAHAIGQPVIDRPDLEIDRLSSGLLSEIEAYLRRKRRNGCSIP